MNQKFRLNLSGAAILPIAIALATPAYGQVADVPAETEAEREARLTTVTVTARKRDETLINAPVAVTAVSGAELEAQGVTNLEQISARVPGLQVGRGAQTSNIFIRGVGSGINKGFEQSVGLYVDGVYQPRSRQFSQSQFDLQQVEVLRGPQGVLFGKNTVAGAIKLETASPEVGEELNGWVGVTWEPEFNTQSYSGVFSAGLADNLAGRLAIRYTTTDGYVENRVFDRDEAEREDMFARATLAWQPTESLNVETKLSYLEMDGVGKELTINAIDDRLPTPSTIALSQMLHPDFGVSTGDTAYVSFSGNPAFRVGDPPISDTETTESLSGSVKAEWEFDNFTLTSITGYSSFDFAQHHDVDFLPVSFIHNLDEEELDMFSQELRIATDWDGRINFLGGLYYENQDAYIEETTAFNGTFGVLPTSILPGGIVNVAQRTFFDQQAETIALFGELGIDLTDSVTLELGLRYSEDEKSIDKSVVVGAGTPRDFVGLVTPADTIGSADLTEYLTAAATVGGADGLNSAATFAALLNRFAADLNDTRTEDHLDPSVKLRWQYADNGSAYISYSTGYKSGGYNFSPDTAEPDGSPRPGHEFDGEKVTAWEAGIKHQFMGDRARIGAVIFRSELEDLQVTSWSGTSFVVGNAAELQVQGLELDGQFLLSDEIEIGGAFAYLDHEFQSFPGAGCSVIETGLGTCPDSAGVGTKDLAGERGAFAPEFSGNVYLAFNRSFENFDLNARIGANFKDEMFLDGDLDPNAFQEGYTKFDAHVGVEFGRYEFRVFGRNLTDEATYTASVDAPLSPGVYVGWIEEPRVIGAEGRINF